jgi:hypothetical protein
MAKARPAKQRQKSKSVQPPLPGIPPPEPPGTTRVLPMQLQIGDRMTDSTGEWEVVGRSRFASNEWTNPVSTEVKP